MEGRSKDKRKDNPVESLKNTVSLSQGQSRLNRGVQEEGEEVPSKSRGGKIRMCSGPVGSLVFEGKNLYASLMCLRSELGRKPGIIPEDLENTDTETRILRNLTRFREKPVQELTEIEIEAYIELLAEGVEKQ